MVSVRDKDVMKKDNKTRQMIILYVNLITLVEHSQHKQYELFQEVVIVK